MKRVGSFRDNFSLEISQQNFLRELKVPENGWMKGAKDALVDEAEVVVAALDHGRLGLVPDPFHHDGVSLKCI